MEAFIKGKTVEKICKEAVRHMVNGMGAERAMVVLAERGESRPKARAVYGLESSEIWTAGEVSTAVIEKVFHQGEPVLVLDAKQQLKSSQSALNAELRSILAVPLRGPDQRIVGFLYADSRSKTALFDYSQEKTLQEIARQFEAVYEKIHNAPPLPTPPEARPDIRPPFLGLFVGGAVAVTAGSLMSGGGPELVLASNMSLLIVFWACWLRSLSSSSRRRQ